MPSRFGANRWDIVVGAFSAEIGNRRWRRIGLVIAIGFARHALHVARVDYAFQCPEQVAVLVDAELNTLDWSAFERRFRNRP